MGSMYLCGKKDSCIFFITTGPMVFQRPSDFRVLFFAFQEQIIFLKALFSFKRELKSQNS